MVVSRSALLAVLLPLVASVAREARAQPPSAAPDRIIVSAPAVSLREGPAATAKQLSKLALGTLATGLERSAGTQTIGGATGSWVRVSTDDGRDGWVFGALTLPYADARRDEVALRIADERLKREDARFEGWLELHSFLVGAAASAAPGEPRVLLQLRRLQALDKAALAIGPGQRKDPRAAAFLEANEKELVYNEPGGSFIAVARLFWELHDANASLPAADEIAWAGARAYLPGECEGYVPCHVGALLATVGKYLALHPRGAHVDEAMATVADQLKGFAEDTGGLLAATSVSREDWAALRRDLEQVKTIVARTGHGRSGEVASSADALLARARDGEGGAP